jgi:ribosomal protein S18 acetylase RimI-like enzyme
MTRENLWSLPQYPLPGGFTIRRFRPGDEWRWAEVETSVGEFTDAKAAREHFEWEFGGRTDELGSRCHLLVAPGGRVVGTASAWYGRDIEGELRGRLHFVAIEPGHQGRGLAKPLVGAAMNRLVRLHRRAYLTTQTTSFKAIKIYLDLGFEPRIETPLHLHGWKLMADLLRHPALARFA